MDKEALGLKIRESRLNKRYTQEVLAERAGIGVMFLGEIERGQKMPSMKTFIKIVNALDISADYILRDEVAYGGQYVFDELTEKLVNLTPKQRKGASEILDAYIRNL